MGNCAGCFVGKRVGCLDGWFRGTLVGWPVGCVEGSLLVARSLSGLEGRLTGRSSARLLRRLCGRTPARHLARLTSWTSSRLTCGLLGRGGRRLCGRFPRRLVRGEPAGRPQWLSTRLIRFARGCLVGCCEGDLVGRERERAAAQLAGRMIA